MSKQSRSAVERQLLAKAREEKPNENAVSYFDPDEHMVKYYDMSNEAEVDSRQDLFLKIYTMLIVSNVIYTFAAMRRLARDAKELYEPGWGIWPVSWFTRKRIDLNIVMPELVLTQDFDGAVENFGGNRYIKRIININDLATFIDKNLDEFARIPDVDINTTEGDIFNTLDLVERARGINGDLREFDDQFADTQLVYGILVNHDEKRVTVTFRGSVSGGEDWSTNLNASLTKMETPDKLKELGFEEQLWVHRGFKEYLIDETPAGDIEEKKYGRIIGNLQGIFSEFPDYELVTTGHSLGGALASLLAFKIAASNDLPNLARPITAISFGAPQIGTDVFNQAYQVLLEKSLLRYIRVSNQGDIVCVVPIFPYNDIFNYYTQNGLNIHLMESSMEMGYRNLKSFYSQTGFSPVANHTLRRYLQRFMRNSVELKTKTETGVFSNREITGGFMG